MTNEYEWLTAELIWLLIGWALTWIAAALAHRRHPRAHRLMVCACVSFAVAIWLLALRNT